MIDIPYNVMSAKMFLCKHKNNYQKLFYGPLVDNLQSYINILKSEGVFYSVGKQYFAEIIANQEIIKAMLKKEKN